MESILNTLTGYIVGLYIRKVTEAIEGRCANDGEHTEHTKRSRVFQLLIV